MTSLSQMQRFGTFNAVLPKEGPKTFPITLDFRTSNVADVDLTLAVEQQFINFISGFFADNSANADDLRITCEGSNQMIIIPPLSQAYMPMLFTDIAKCQITTTVAADLLVPMQFVNFPLTPCVWSII